MKTKEFIKKIEKMGYDIEIAYDTIRVTYDGGILARIDKVKPYTLDTKATFEVKHVKELFDLCVEYARTPIEEREEEKKYYLRMSDGFYIVCDEYLNFNKSAKHYVLHSKHQNDSYKTQFTQKEIDEIKEKFNTDLSEFEQIPVDEIEAE